MDVIRKRAFKVMASRGIYMWTVYWIPKNTSREVVEVVGTFSNPRWEVIVIFRIG